MRRAGPLSALLPAVLVAAGCAPRLDIARPAVALPPAYAVADDPAPVDLARWWTRFGDRQLDELVARALRTGADSRLALARLREAQAIRRAALSPYRVQGELQVAGGIQRSETLSGPDFLIGGPGGTSVPSGETVTAVSPSFNLSWELDLIGRRGVAAKAADGDMAAARFLYEGSRAALAADVADTLFAARGLAAEANAAREAVRIQRQSLALVETRVARGLSPHSDAARIDADLARAEAQAAMLEAELVATKRALLVLVGDGDKPVGTLPITGDLAAPPPVPATLPGDLLARRADVREADQRVRAGIARAELQRRELFPRFTLNPGIGLTAARSNGVDAVGAVWTLAAGLVVPILDRARLLSQMRVEGARAEQAVIAYEKTVQTAFAEADQALVRLSADRARIALLTRAEARAAQAHDAVRLGFSRGLGDLATLLDAQRVHADARAAAASARAEGLRRAVTVFRALGGGWDAAPLDMKNPKGE